MKVRTTIQWEPFGSCLYEEFGSLAAAKDFFRDQWRDISRILNVNPSYGTPNMTVMFDDRPVDSIGTDGFWISDGEDMGYWGDTHPDRIITIGPRGGLREERA